MKLCPHCGLQGGHDRMCQMASTFGDTEADREEKEAAQRTEPWTVEDIVHRLRNFRRGEAPQIMFEAADEIDRLRACRPSTDNVEQPFTNPNHAKTCALYWDKLLQGINSACGCGGLEKDRQLKDGSGSDQPASAAEWRDNYNACWDRARSDVKYDALKSAALKALNYIENTENELGIKLSCGDALREALK